MIYCLNGCNEGNRSNITDDMKHVDSIKQLQIVRTENKKKHTHLARLAVRQHQNEEE